MGGGGYTEQERREGEKGEGRSSVGGRAHPACTQHYTSCHCERYGAVKLRRFEEGRPSARPAENHCGAGTTYLHPSFFVALPWYPPHSQDQR